ncbi:MAG: hypothetical protein WA655_21670 [Candidatus Korobacteraceae bacterium]
MLWFRPAFLAVVFLFNSGFVMAQFPVGLGNIHEDTQPAQTRELVSKYCRLDYDGARLNPQSWSKIQPLVWWKTSPEYNKINVIARYTVDPGSSSGHTKYTVTVHYRLLGTLDLANGYVPEPENTTQDVSYVVSSENSDWRIADAENTLPHPSRAAMLKWLNNQIGTTQDETMKAIYQAALKQLQAQSASPFAK